MSNFNTTSINTTKTATYFTFDHINKKIVGSEFNFKMSGNSTKPQYVALVNAMAMHPNYTLTPIPSSKKVEKKQSYKGLNSDLITEYVEVFGNAAQKAELDKMVNDNEAFPAIKSWFLDYFKAGFSVEKAKRDIAHRKLSTKKATVRKVVKANMVKAEEAKASAPIDFPKVVNQ